MWKRFVALWTLIAGDARLLWRARRHPQAPRWLKPALALVALYVISPIDLIPDVVPIFGVVDDLILVPLALRFLVRRLPAALRADGMRAVP